jgi:hypothetical protein
VLWLSGATDGDVYASRRGREADRTHPGRHGPARAVRLAAARATTPSVTPASLLERCALSRPLARSWPCCWQAAAARPTPPARSSSFAGGRSSRPSAPAAHARSGGRAPRRR